VSNNRRERERERVQTGKSQVVVWSGSSVCVLSSLLSLAVRLLCPGVNLTV
jgi:hypothetical protein